MNQSVRISYVIMAVLLVLLGALHLGPLLLTALFGFFALRLLSFGKSKFLGLVLYLVAIAVIGWGLTHFSRQAYLALPKIVETTIPAVTDFAQKQGIELPFTDYASLKELTLNEVKQDFASLGLHAREAGFAVVQILIGLVVAASLFLSAKWGTENDPGTARDSLYATVVDELSRRFQIFFQSFAKVTGAQIIISAINTVLTCAFLLWAGYSYVAVITATTFLCGVLPIIGNLISNTLIVFVGFTISPHVALFALIFLVVIHKLEYFLNSKIIGDRIKTPMWLTLIGIVLGEKLMGIPGMILAPIVLHYLKVETSQSRSSAA
jgi:predicted PurR-regulated permease PerM